MSCLPVPLVLSPVACFVLSIISALVWITPGASHLLLRWWCYKVPSGHVLLSPVVDVATCVWAPEFVPSFLPYLDLISLF